MDNMGDESEPDIVECQNKNRHVAWGLDGYVFRFMKCRYIRGGCGNAEEI